MIFLILIPALYLLVQTWQLSVLFRYNSRGLQHFAAEELPEVSIWVACRNEEKNIHACIDSLLKLNYPSHKIQILIGNDQSTDATREIALEFAQKHANIKVVDVVDNDSGLKAKARVMAQLDIHATGNFYLITDADVRVKPNWIQGLLSNMNPEMGVCSGTTMVRSNGIDGWLQEIDWAYFMGLLNVISYSGVPATAVGNNMIIRKEAYWQTGGYSQIQFSITEDYKLYSEVCAKGWKWNNIMNEDVLAFSEKTEGFGNLLHQRKRWLSGGKELPWYWWILFGIYGGFYFVIPLLSIYFLWEAQFTALCYIGLLWGLKFIFQSLQIHKIYRLVNEKTPHLGRLFIYEFYLFAVTTFTALFFVLPVKTKWKNRSYKV
jgi:cellulose synthase/poly-beta-1,6-N-acetylglucosamine synthase-like glycosyltransferase